jgi:hypothetical protein
MQATGDWRHRLDLITEFANMNTSSASPTEQLLPAKDVIRADWPKDGKRLVADGQGMTGYTRWRPFSDVRCPDRVDTKPPLGLMSRYPRRPRRGGHTPVRRANK